MMRKGGHYTIKGFFIGKMPLLRHRDELEVEPFFYDEIDGVDPVENGCLKMPLDRARAFSVLHFAPGSTPSASVTRIITTSAIIAMNIVTTLLASLFEGYSSVWRW